MFEAAALVAVCLCAATSSAQTAAVPAPDVSKAPRLVMIVRHAEKSPDDRDPDLTPIGRERASRLPLLFEAHDGMPPRFARPDFIFAAAPAKKSNRPAETAAPLGKALNEHVNLDFERNDDSGLAKEVMSGRYAGKVVIIFWHHGTIPQLAADFGITDAPKWKDETFDQVWEIDFNAGAAHLTTAPEQLMPGDSNH